MTGYGRPTEDRSRRRRWSALLLALAAATAAGRQPCRPGLSMSSRSITSGLARRRIRRLRNSGCRGKIPAVSAAIGEIAPDFVLHAADGAPLQLSGLRGCKVVLFFYPRDDSPVCTVQACAFRDAYEELTTAGAEVVGVSSDSAESHRRFAAKRALRFPIVSDPDGSVRRLYGASSSSPFGEAGRVTYLIDEEGSCATSSHPCSVPSSTYAAPARGCPISAETQPRAPDEQKT